MAEGSRLKSLEDQAKKQDHKMQEFMDKMESKWEEQDHKMQSKWEEHNKDNNVKMDSFMNGIDAKMTAMMKLLSKEHSQAQNQEEAASINRAPLLPTPIIRNKEELENRKWNHHLYPKVELCVFEGEHPRNWIRKSEELQMLSIGILNAIVPTNNSLAFKNQEALSPYANCNEKSTNETVLGVVEQNVFDESSQLNSCIGDQDIETTRKHNFTCFIEGLSKKKESLKSVVEPLEKMDSEGRIKVLTDYEAFSSASKSSQEGIGTYQEFQEKVDGESFMTGYWNSSPILKKFEWHVINESPEMVLNIWSECLKGAFSWGRSNSLPKFNAKYHEFTASSESPTQRLVGLTRGFHQYHVLYLISENDWLVMKHTKKGKNTSFATRENASYEIIGRSLVTASRKGSQGTIKVCRMHDLLRDFCFSKAREENFLQLVTEPVKYEKHRVCIYLNRKHFFNSSPSGPCTRSLICFATNDQYPTCPYDLSFIPNNFKVLKVLDLENINMGTSFPTGIELLVQLRYLAACGDMKFIPPAISKLQKLETFIVKGFKGKVQLPDSIWCMERFPNLRKLRCTYLESWDSFMNDSKFPVLDFLTQLQVDISLASLMIRAEAMLHEAGLCTVINDCKVEELDSVVSCLQEKVERIKLEIKEICAVLSDSSLKSKSCSSDEILEFLDCLIGNLKDLVNVRADIVVSVKNQIMVLEEKLSFLINVVDFTAKRCTEHQKLEVFFDYVNDWVHKAACLYLLCWHDGKDEKVAQKLETMLSDLMQKIQLSTPEVADMFVEVLKASKSSRSDKLLVGQIVAGLVDFLLEDLVDFVMDYVEILREGLIFMITFFMDPPEVSETNAGDGIFTQINRVIIEVISLISSLYMDALKVDISMERKINLSSLQYKIEKVKAEVGKLYVQVPSSSNFYFPMTNGMGFIELFLENLKEMLQCNPSGILFAKHQVGIVQEELLSLKPFLKDIMELQNEHEELKDLWKRITSKLEEVVVGLKDESVTIIDRLTRGTTQLDIISIVGMSGLDEDLAEQLWKGLKGRRYCHYKDGILRYKDKLFIGAGRGIRKQIISTLHDSAAGGHSGQNACWRRISGYFYWPGLKRDVVEFVRNLRRMQ